MYTFVYIVWAISDREVPLQYKSFQSLLSLRIWNQQWWFLRKREWKSSLEKRKSVLDDREAEEERKLSQICGRKQKVTLLLNQSKGKMLFCLSSFWNEAVPIHFTTVQGNEAHSLKSETWGQIRRHNKLVKMKQRSVSLKGKLFLFLLPKSSLFFYCHLI